MTRPVLSRRQFHRRVSAPAIAHTRRRIITNASIVDGINLGIKGFFAAAAIYSALNWAHCRRIRKQIEDNTKD